MLSKAPVLFVSHGAPTFATDPGVAGRLLQEAGAHLFHCQAVLVVSPHWMTQGWEVTAAAAPDILYDFSGFSPELYRLQYPVKGAPEQALAVQALLKAQGLAVKVNFSRGLDHGAWVPMMHLRPAADIPVFQLSMNIQADAQQLLELGETLATLRQQGVAIVASGGATHNLRDVRYDESDVAPYVLPFIDWLRAQVQNRSYGTLMRAHFHEHFSRAHPTPEHFLPLLVAMGATQAEDALSVLEGGVRYRALAMESYLWR